ncbi:PucR family transcriptional regulator [Niallia sp. Krafla_26]|uniref:PucR family transcriptional regulator n=1 Tax=Niallia sp. Krafla_26 TaxID=3064703 RepID=UPI003D16BCBA
MLTFQELITASPFNQANIIGGWKGKEKSFLHVQDTPIGSDVTLLLMQSEPDTVAQLQDYLFLPHIQGILLFGKMEPYLTNEEVNEIDTHHKPVLFLKEEINLVSLKKSISDLAHLKSIGLYQYVFEHSTRYWVELIDSQGLAPFFKRLSLILGQEIFLLDEYFYLHSIHSNHQQESFKHLESLYQSQNAGRQEPESLLLLQDRQEHYFLFPLVTETNQYGFVVFKEQPNMMIDICIEQVIHTIPALLSFFKKEEAVLRAHQSYKDNFLYNLLYNNIESEQLLFQQGKQWGWDFAKQAELMVIRFNQKMDQMNSGINIELMLKKIQLFISSRSLHGIIFKLQGDIIVIIFEDSSLLPKQRKDFTLTLAQQIHDQLKKELKELECEIGIGRHYASNKELFRSFYEAKVAIELGKYEIKKAAVRHFEDIGIGRLLSNIHRNTLHDYYAEVLRDVLLDQENKTVHLETLESFFYNNADINLTAEQLYVHPNTLRKRLKKLELILNADFNQLEDLLEIYVAIKIMKMIK